MDTIPKRQDTAPPEFVKMAEGWLYDRAETDEDLKALLAEQGCFGQFPLNDHIPDEWIEALAQEFDAAILDRGLDWVRTLREGRPIAQALVEWEARDPDTIPIEDAPEAAASQERCR